ncbi:hypothetical protein [Croceiramulus getboli]|nr:hypothetical protein P8624_04500 [Flavobacteriaceae bacterium YJPT1-3]
MGLQIKQHKAVFLGIMILTIALGMMSSFLLPDRYFYDAWIIARDTYNEKGWWGSYPISMSFYHYTGLGQLPFWLIAGIQIPILFYALSRIGIPTVFHQWTLRNAVTYLSLLLIAFFIAMPSKEFITFLVMAALVNILSRQRYPRNYTVLILCVVLVLFGLWFRPYFALIPVLALVFYLFSLVPMRAPVLAAITAALGVIILLSLSYGFVKGTNFSEETREALNVFRQGSPDASSMIVSPVKTDTWYGESIGIVYGFLTVNFPVNGITHFLKPQILAFILWQLVLMGILIYHFAICLRRRKAYPYALWMFFFVFSYLIIQGVFEPDLGSAIRHKLGVFPLFFYCLYFDYFGGKKD